jgi:hypothetical protein
MLDHCAAKNPSQLGLNCEGPIGKNPRDIYFRVWVHPQSAPKSVIDRFWPATID